MNILVYMGSL